MPTQTAEHSTISLARTYDAPVARVFAALADPKERLQVMAGSQRLTFDFQETDLRIGGRDVFRFGLRGRLHYRCESLYHDVAPGRRIVFTDVVSAGDVRLWIGVTTLELTPTAKRTMLKVTSHMVRLDDAESYDGCDARYAVLLDDLERYLRHELSPGP
jgi:uncharacterized protein YndB with AHSA1/START domain